VSENFTPLAFLAGRGINESGETLSEAYESAVLKAAKEMKVAESWFPPTCPFALEQVLDTDYWPD
jgi:hypothetical protein